MATQLTFAHPHTCHAPVSPCRYVWMHYKSLVIAYQLPVDSVVYRFALLSPTDQRTAIGVMQGIVDGSGRGFPDAFESMGIGY